MDGWTAQCSLAAAECRCGREEGTGRGERGGGGIIAAFRRGAGAELITRHDPFHTERARNPRWGGQEGRRTEVNMLGVSELSPPMPSATMALCAQCCRTSPLLRVHACCMLASKKRGTKESRLGTDDDFVSLKGR